MSIDIIQIIPSLGLGGAEIVVENLTNELVKNQKKVLIISLFNKKTYISERIQKAGIDIIFLDKKNGLDLSMIFKLIKIFKQYKPKVIHSHLTSTIYSVPAAVFSKIDIKIHTVHSLANKEGSKAIRLLYKMYYNLMKLKPVAISIPVKKTILDLYSFEENQVPLIYNGTDLTRYKKKNNYDIDTENIKIVHVGSFKEPKNHRMIISALKKLSYIYPKFSMNLIGNGENQNEIRDYVKMMNLEDSISFIGEVENVQEYLTEADIFILPSLWEGMPISLIEAMASALPIVATNVGGIPDMIEDNKSGLLIGADENELSSAIIELIENKELREKLGQNAFEKSNEYSSYLMGKNYIKLYKKLGG